jgi:hypothetical protein
MAEKSAGQVRSGDRRVRQVYHDVERRSGTDRRGPPSVSIIKEESRPPGLVRATIICLIAFLVTDALAWHGASLRAVRLAAETQASAVADWSSRAWF